MGAISRRERASAGSARPRRVPPVRAVFFDFDDTLFDHSRALVEGLRVLRSTERRLTTRSFPRVVREYERLLDAIQPGRPGGPPDHPAARVARFRLLDRWLGGSGDPETGARWSSTYRRAYQAARRPVPGAVPLLRRLRGEVSVGVVTNNHTAEQLEKLAALDLERWIDFMVTSEDIGVSKPDPAIFEAALRRSGTSPEETTMVGDSWTSDVLGARAAGLSAVWLRRRGRRPVGRPEVRVLRSFSPVATAHRLVLGRSAPARSRRKGSRRTEHLLSHGRSPRDGGHDRPR